MSMLAPPASATPQAATPLADSVDVVIGVDTHEDTHTAAGLASATGAVLARATVTADPVPPQAGGAPS